jgi:hypothetical protein
LTGNRITVKRHTVGEELEENKRRSVTGDRKDKGKEWRRTRETGKIQRKKWYRTREGRVIGNIKQSWAPDTFFCIRFSIF